MTRQDEWVKEVREMSDEELLKEVLERGEGFSWEDLLLYEMVMRIFKERV